MRQKRQKCAKMKIFTSVLLHWSRKRFYRGEFRPYPGRDGKFQEELATLNASKGENHGEIEQKEAQITEIRQTIEEFKGII